MTFYINGEKNITQHSKSHQICRISDGRMICKALSPHACCVALRRDFFFFLHRGDVVSSLRMYIRHLLSRMLGWNIRWR